MNHGVQVNTCALWIQAYVVRAVIGWDIGALLLCLRLDSQHVRARRVGDV